MEQNGKKKNGIKLPTNDRLFQFHVIEIMYDVLKYRYIALSGSKP